MNSSDLIAKLSVLLRWSGNPEIPNQFERIFYHHASHGLGWALARIDKVDRPRAAALRARLRGVADTVFLRLVGAPQTWHFVVGYEEVLPNPEHMASYLTESLDAEEHRAGDRPVLDHGVWSCVGDCYFPATARMSSPEPAELIWDPDRPFVAPQLPGGLPVDFWSPFARGPLPEVSGSDVDMERAEIEHTLWKLREGLDAMVQACPVVSGFVSRFSKAIIARKDPPETRTYTSASSCTALGRLILRNPQLNVATPMELVDGIIHETIHFVIDIVEMEQPIIRDRSILPVQRGDSPWTGRSLDLNTYVQACFVWYGLWNFWYRVFGLPSFSARAVLDYMQMSSKGFVLRDVTEPLIPVQHAIAPGLIDVLRSMQTDMREMFSVVEEAQSLVSFP